jgi:hypothetical protein
MAAQVSGSCKEAQASLGFAVISMLCRKLSDGIA